MFKGLLLKLHLLMACLPAALLVCMSLFGWLIQPAGADTGPSSCGISPTTLPAGTVGSPYSATLQAGGGTLPYTWSIISGALPAGLTLNSGTGVISGIPLAAQTYSFTVRADDSASHYCTISISIQVNSNTAAENLTSIQTLMISKADTLLLSAGVLPVAKELASSDGRVKLGLAAGTTINMQGQSQLGAAAESNPPAATDNSTLVRAYSFIPAGATFSPPATMTLRYEAASLLAGASESGLYLSYWNGSAWQQLSSTVNTTLKEVSAPVAHFTTFAIRCPALSTSAATTTPSTAASANITISTDILGTTTSFVTISGVLTSAATLSSAGGKLSISLADNTTVSLPTGGRQITVIQIASPPAAPSGAKLLEAYAFTPDNATFTPAAVITVKYAADGLPSDVHEADLYLAVSENSTWTLLASTVNTQAKTVSAQLSHFSIYALLGKVTTAPATPIAPPAPAISAFSTSDLTVSPETAAPGQQVSVSVRIVNGGTGEATKTVILKIDDQAQEQKDIKLAAGKSQVVSFNLSKSEPGKYTVSVDGQSTSFTVKESAARASDGMSVAILAVIIAGGLLVIGLVVVRILRQTS
ncbi:MAG: putative Ig domain-containing protein [Chloroflexi bacterium]|nr:putative Ig domain-containing protein [Chloroflexota bacterium]